MSYMANWKTKKSGYCKFMPATVALFSQNI